MLAGGQVVYKVDSVFDKICPCENLFYDRYYITLPLQQCARFCSRHSNQQTSDYGQIGIRSLRTVQPRHRAGRISRRHQQEALAGNHQRVTPSIVHHVRGFHTQNSVSKIRFLFAGRTPGQNAIRFDLPEPRLLVAAEH